MSSDYWKSHCSCTDNSTGEQVNFCYQHPRNPFLIGRKFSCDWLPFLRDLGLLWPTDYVQPWEVDQLTPAFVSAADKNYFPSALALIVRFQSLFPGKALIFYDLGFTYQQALQIKAACNVEYRRFPFERFPPYMRHITEYRFKFYIIAEMLKQYKMLWWFDTSVVIKSADIMNVHGTPRCEAKPVDPAAIGTTEPLATNSGNESSSHCLPPSLVLFINTNHGNYPVTEPEMYSYFPANIEALRQKECTEFGAGFLLIYRSEETMRSLMYWMVLCSLEKNCMAPAKSNMQCSFKDRFEDHISRCHRFDQSAINLLLANLFSCELKHHTDSRFNFYDIVRGQKTNIVPKQCNS